MKDLTSKNYRWRSLLLLLLPVASMRRKLLKTTHTEERSFQGRNYRGGACPPLLEFENYYNSHCCWTTKFQVKTPKLFLEMKLICSLLLSYNLNFQKMKLICSLLLSYNLNFQKMKLICSLLLSYNMQSITEL